MDVEKALEWITNIFAIKDRVVRIDDKRESIPEWDSLGTLSLRSRLQEDYGIELTDDAITKLNTVRDICQILEKKPSGKTQHVLPQGSTDTLTQRTKEHLNRLSNAGRRTLSALPSKQKRVLRNVHKRFVNTMLSYGPQELLESLRSLGVAEGDTILVHSSFKYSNGFIGSPETVIDVLLESVGRSGNLMMVSIPYRGSAYEYLKSLKYFDVRRTVSQMGLLTEIFRERKGVLRSLNPTHPILAYGPKAQWLIAGHENCPYPCGKGTPFEKLVQMDGKVVFFDAPWTTMTFFHHIEDMHRNRIPMPIYHHKPFQVPVIDSKGREITVFVYVFSPAYNRRRRPKKVELQVRRQGLIKSEKIGNTQLLCTEVSSIVEFMNKMIERGNLFFYDDT